MALVTVRTCDICKAIIPDGTRKFTVYINLKISNGHEREAAQAESDICGEECLVRVVREVVREVETPLPPLPATPASPLALALSGDDIPF